MQIMHLEKINLCFTYTQYSRKKKYKIKLPKLESSFLKQITAKSNSHNIKRHLCGRWNKCRLCCILKFYGKFNYILDKNNILVVYILNVDRVCCKVKVGM